METGKTTKYFKYAIGEIILVVIGILIALQINTWKEQNQYRKLEKQILNSLNIEFKSNLQKIKQSIDDYEQSEQSLRFLMSKMKANSEELSKYNIDSLIAVSVDVFDFRPTQNTLTEVLSTGNLNLISNNSLKYNLIQWSAELNEISEAWSTLDDFNQNALFPYLTKNVSMKNIDSYSLMKWKKKSEFKVDYEKTFNDLEFENHLDNLGWAIVNYKMVLLRLEKIILEIIYLTND
jgi:hypothetical protein